MSSKKKLSPDYVEKNFELKLSQLQRRKQIYRDINTYIVSLKMSLDTADKKDSKKIKKYIKKLVKIQDNFSDV